MVLFFAFVLFYSAALSGSVSKSLRLDVNPIFEFVNEDWPVGEALPDLTVCAVKTSGTNLVKLSITNGDNFGYFNVHQLNGSCWTLILTKELDADLLNSDGTRGQLFSLTFRYSDGSLQTYGNLDVQVVDINDNPPLFVGTDSAVSISENTEPNQIIFSVTTVDPDTGVGGINSFRLSDDFNGRFAVRNERCSDSRCSADVVLLKPVNYESRNVYPLDIIATDGAGRIQKVNSATFKVVINVVDVQNNPPKFVTDNRIRYVAENTPVGEKVFQVQAVDGDTGVLSPNRIVYRMLIGGPYFQIDTTTGWVVVGENLDRENFSLLRANGAITLSIQAEEETEMEPRPRSSVNFTVLLTDVNDEVPKCNESWYFAQVMENSQTLIPLTLTNAAQLYVFDKDQGSNGEFEVSLEGDGALLFDVMPKIVFQEANLLLRVRNSDSLDHETLKSVDMTILLTPRQDSATLKTTGSCGVTVNVIDTNDNAPQFNQSLFYGEIFENKNPGTHVTKITVFDGDSEVYLPIVLSLNGDGAEKFMVGEDGTIRNVVPLDREQKGSSINYVDIFRLRQKTFRQNLSTD